jgi:hypothetical protein
VKLKEQNEQLFKEIQLLNYKRKEKQVKAEKDLNQRIWRRDESISKAWQINASCSVMESLLLSQSAKRSKKVL